MAKEKGSYKKNTISNSTISGNFSQGDNNRTEIRTIQIRGENQPDSPEEIIKLIGSIHRIISNSNLPREAKKRCSRHIQTIDEEVREENPDKEFAAKALKKIFRILNENDGSCQPNGDLIDQLQPVMTRVLPWMGKDKKFLVL